jgi:hypothetical protein
MLQLAILRTRLHFGPLFYLICTSSSPHAHNTSERISIAVHDPLLNLETTIRQANSKRIEFLYEVER